MILEAPEIRRQARDRDGYRPRYQIVHAPRPVRSPQRARWGRAIPHPKLLLSDVRRMRARWAAEQAWLTAAQFARAEVARLACDGVRVSPWTVRDVIQRHSWAWDLDHAG
jgi:hypothetical protein